MLRRQKGYISYNTIFGHFTQQNIVSIVVQIFVYKYKYANICMALLQTICLITIKYLIGLPDWILWA